LVHILLKKVNYNFIMSSLCEGVRTPSSNEEVEIDRIIP